MKSKKVAIIGGGAAGYFFAANASKFDPNTEFTIYEQGKRGLQKVKISGGGRCNVTHHCFNPTDLAQNYPRGQKELIGPFHKFGPEQTIDWFEKRGVPIKTEKDGRMFPCSNKSQSIIDCLENECKTNGVNVRYSQKLTSISPIDNGNKGYNIQFLQGNEIHVDSLMLATGSSKLIWKMLRDMGFKIVAPVPSLFTFQIFDERISDLAGITVEDVEISISKQLITQKGALLITHKGLSGPSILKLSAFGARWFHEQNYRTRVSINFLPKLSIPTLKNYRDQFGKQLVKEKKWNIPKRLAATLLRSSDIDLNKKWASLSNKELEIIHDVFCNALFEISGQNTFKEEFVTAGGIDLKEINFSNFSSRHFENLFFAGEILNIDAITGGYNFQAAWTGAYLAALSFKY